MSLQSGLEPASQRSFRDLCLLCVVELILVGGGYVAHLGFPGTYRRAASWDALSISGLLGWCWATLPRNLGVSDRTAVHDWGLGCRNHQVQDHLSSQTLKAFSEKEDENGGFENQHY